MASWIYNYPINNLKSKSAPLHFREFFIRLGILYRNLCIYLAFLSFIPLPSCWKERRFSSNGPFNNTAVWFGAGYFGNFMNFTEIHGIFSIENGIQKSEHKFVCSEHLDWPLFKFKFNLSSHIFGPFISPRCLW